MRSVEEASDSEFDVFIRQYVEVGWSLEERRDALNFAIESGKLEIPGLEPETESKNQSENQKKIKDDLISENATEAQEASV